jgi:hypothetical protein
MDSLEQSKPLFNYVIKIPSVNNDFQKIFHTQQTTYKALDEKINKLYKYAKCTNKHIMAAAAAFGRRGRRGEARTSKKGLLLLLGKSQQQHCSREDSKKKLCLCI